MRKAFLPCVTSAVSSYMHIVWLVSVKLFFSHHTGKEKTSTNTIYCTKKHYSTIRDKHMQVLCFYFALKDIENIDMVVSRGFSRKWSTHGGYTLIYLRGFEVLDQHLLVALDGTEYYSSHQVSCPCCSIRRHRNGQVTYSHKAILPVIVSPSQSSVISFWNPHRFHGKIAWKRQSYPLLYSINIPFFISNMMSLLSKKTVNPYWGLWNIMVKSNYFMGQFPMKFLLMVESQGIH